MSKSSSNELISKDKLSITGYFSFFSIFGNTIPALILFLIIGFSSLFLGVSDLTLGDLLSGKQEALFLLFTGRLPRFIAITITGAGLAICGLIMQQISNNKFVSPSTAGTISSAKLGILISLVLFPTDGLLVKATFAFTIAMIGSILFMKILSTLKFTDIIIVPLVGIIFGEIIEATCNFFAYKYFLLQVISSWTQGDFSLVIKDRFELLYLAIPLLIFAIFYAQKFSIVGMGKDNATNLGVNYKTVVLIGLLIISAVTGMIVVIAGTIPFVGLIVPNVVSLWYGDNLKNTIALTAIYGALFTLCCDMLARSLIFPYELAVGSVIGSIGSVIFIYLIYRKYRYGN